MVIPWVKPKGPWYYNDDMDGDPDTVPEERRTIPAFQRIWEEELSGTSTFANGTITTEDKVVQAGPRAVLSEGGKLISMKPK